MELEEIKRIAKEYEELEGSVMDFMNTVIEYDKFYRTTTNTVERFGIFGNVLEVVLDNGWCGDNDQKLFQFPLKFLTLQPDELFNQLNALKAERIAKMEEARRIDYQTQKNGIEARDRLLYEKLKRKYEDTNNS